MKTAKNRKQSTARLIAAGSENSADLRYACGFQPTDPVVLLHTARERHLVVPMLELGRARNEAPTATVHTPGDLGLSPSDRRSLAAWTVAITKKTKTQRVRVDSFFPAGIMRALEAANVRVEIADDALYPEREIKSAKEIEFIAQSQRAAAQAMRAAVEEIRAAHVNRAGELVSGKKTLSSERLRQLIQIVLLKNDCDGKETIAACGRHAADPHHRGEGPLRAGETIVLDIFPQHLKTGYWGDITRTVVKGPASAALKRLYRAVLNAQRIAREMIKPGIRADQVHQNVARTLSSAGYQTKMRDGVPVGFFHGTGHGVGLSIHENPRVALASDVLRVGHVVTVEPGLYYPELGGVRIEDTVAVTKSGAKILAACPYTFEIK